MKWLKTFRIGFISCLKDKIMRLYMLIFLVFLFWGINIIILTISAHELPEKNREISGIIGFFSCITIGSIFAILLIIKNIKDTNIPKNGS